MISILRGDWFYVLPCVILFLCFTVLLALQLPRFVEFGGRIFQQTIGIPMGTNCAPLLADLFLYSYEAEFVQSLLQAGKKHLAQQFNFTYRYIDDVLSLKN